MVGNSFLRHQLSCIYYYPLLYTMQAEPIQPSTRTMSNKTIYEPITTCCRLIGTNIINKHHKYDDGATIYLPIFPLTMAKFYSKEKFHTAQGSVKQ